VLSPSTTVPGSRVHHSGPPPLHTMRTGHAILACAVAIGTAHAQEGGRKIRLKVSPDADVDSIQYTPGLLLPEERAGLLTYYADMPLDPYLESVSRTRRFGKYLLSDILTDEDIIEVEYKGNVFIQTGTYNDLVKVGKMAVVRQYEEHTPEFMKSAAMQSILKHLSRSMLDMGAPVHVPFELGIHAVRLTAPGEVTPEGVHRDGYHFVLSTVINRHCIDGGHSLVHTGKLDKPLLDVPMGPGDSLMINDRAVYHSVSNVTVAHGCALGTRDVVLVTARPWPTNAEGELVDDVTNAQLSLLEGTLEVPEPAPHEVDSSEWGMFSAMRRVLRGAIAAST